MHATWVFKHTRLICKDCKSCLKTICVRLLHIKVAYSEAQVTLIYHLVVGIALKALEIMIGTYLFGKVCPLVVGVTKLLLGMVLILLGCVVPWLSLALQAMLTCCVPYEVFSSLVSSMPEGMTTRKRYGAYALNILVTLGTAVGVYIVTDFSSFGWSHLGPYLIEQGVVWISTPFPFTP
jgi:hypothetical protein